MDTQDVDAQIEQLEVSMENAKKMVEDADALIRLSTNPDFTRIITDGYFAEESSRLVLTKALPNMSSDELQKDINNAIIAIGYLKRHFNSIMAMAGMARKSINESEKTRAEILEEAAQ